MLRDAHSRKLQFRLENYDVAAGRLTWRVRPGPAKCSTKDQLVKGLPTLFTARPQKQPFHSDEVGGFFFQKHGPFLDLASNYAHETNYPYQLMLAEKDHLISNKIARVWHEKTKSKDKNMRLIVGAYHDFMS